MQAEKCIFLKYITFNKSSWSELKRNEDPSYFCVRAVEKAIKNCGSEGTELLKSKIWNQFIYYSTNTKWMIFVLY